MVSPKMVQHLSTGDNRMFTGFENEVHVHHSAQLDNSPIIDSRARFRF
jgi:hypothetical protein